MTDIFRELKDNFPKEDGFHIATSECEQARTVCLYQIAVSLNEIDKTLKEINRSLNKRR